MITLTCHGCGTKLKAKAESLSGRAKCPKCGARIESAAPSSTLEPEEEDLPPLPVKKTKTRTDPNDAKAVMRALLAGFTGEVRRRGPTLGYRFALLMTTFALCLLMLSYLALIAGTGFGVWLYAIHIAPTALQMHGRAAGLLLVVHAAVLISGAMLVFSMIAPFFMRSKEEESGEGVGPSQAPILHSFVAKIADTVGAPKPVEIRLALSANASASYRHGMWGLLSKQLVLTIGTPLLAGMSTQQIAGIIAHELGHFSQSGGMLLNRFVMQMAQWFAQAAATQEGISSVMADGDSDEHASIAIFRFVFWVTQLLGSLVFWMFAWIGLGLSMFVSRRQEYDADRYAAELAGSDVFFGTSRRMIELMMGEATVMRQGWRAILATLQEHEGVENLTSEIVAAADRASETSAPTIEKVLQAPTGLFDSHPGMRDRVKAVRQNPQPGLFAVKLPGYALYPRFNPNPQ